MYIILEGVWFIWRIRRYITVYNSRFKGSVTKPIQGAHSYLLLAEENRRVLPRESSKL